MLAIPTLETERLLLRAFRDDDIDAYAALSADPEVMRFLGGPQARPDAWRSIAAMLGHWVLRGFGVWAVERKSDRALLGRAGIQRPEGWSSEEVVWTLGREHWKQGYATEAARAGLDYGFKSLPVAKLVSFIDAENLASQNVAKRLGYSKGSSTTLFAVGKFFDVDIWEIPRTRWSPRAE
jgi:RimJ/RimL family protein N-acetyltransferase